MLFFYIFPPEKPEGFSVYDSVLYNKEKRLDTSHNGGRLLTELQKNSPCLPAKGSEQRNGASLLTPKYEQVTPKRFTSVCLKKKMSAQKRENLR